MGEPTTGEVRQDVEGWVNPCFFVGDRLVVRFNARDAHVPKFRRERVAYELLRTEGLPVPRVLHHDESRTRAPWEVLVTERLPGRSVESSWSDLDEKTRRDLAAEAGTLLARLHAIPIQGFGELAGPASERHATWKAWVLSDLERVLGEARDDDVLDEEVLKTAEDAVRLRVERIQAQGAVPFEAALVHGDFHLGNVLHVDGRVSGVLDLEWSLAGDPLFDLVSMNALDELTPGAREPLLEAWRAARPGEDGEGARLPIYRCLRNVVLTTISVLHFTEEEAVQAREVTTRQVRKLAGEEGLEAPRCQ